MRLVLLSLTLATLAAPAAACGPDTDCMIGDRHYRIAMPADHDGETAVPAMVYSHGYRGSAKGVMQNKSLRGLASDLGVALIAVKSVGPGWDLPNNPREMSSTGERELAYFDAVLEHAAENFRVDSDRLLATGFSGGGMMVWTLICSRSDSFAGFAPISGTFWLEPPETCSGPVANVIHIHGDNDPTVPLEGRPIGPTKQGEVSEALAMYSAYGNFSDPKVARYDDLNCEEKSNPTGDLLSFCLFAGGHSFKTEFVRFAWEKLEDMGRL
ncbi:MAG: prolyl oligopeptidase family serine peptidase [Pseudomonadota bacterium]